MHVIVSLPLTSIPAPLPLPSSYSLSLSLPRAFLYPPSTRVDDSTPAGYCLSPTHLNPSASPPSQLVFSLCLSHAPFSTPHLKQRNSTDCGILQMMSMNYLCEDLPFNFDETDCPRFRQKIALNLMRNRLD